MFCCECPSQQRVRRQTLKRMQIQALVRLTRGRRLHPLIWVTGIALLGALFYLAVSPQRAHSQKFVQEPVVRAPQGTEPILPQVIKSKATDQYEYLADVLRQLRVHPHSSCRNEIAGPKGLIEGLAKAKAFKARGNLDDAELLLKSVENRLDRKYKLECIRLG